LVGFEPTERRQKMKTNIVIALLGLIAGLLIASLVGGRDVALAQGISGGGSAMTNGDMIAVALNNAGTQRDMLAVVDTKHKRVALYDFRDSTKLSMVASRNITYDLQIEGEYIYEGRHISPGDVKKQVEKGAKEK
jgi:hypothetical protein